MRGGGIGPDRRTLAIQMMAAALGGLGIGIAFILGSDLVAGVVVLVVSVVGIAAALHRLSRR